MPGGEGGWESEGRHKCTPSPHGPGLRYTVPPEHITHTHTQVYRPFKFNIMSNRKPEQICILKKVKNDPGIISADRHKKHAIENDRQGAEGYVL